MGISVGLVGLGQFGSEFVELFRRHPRVDRIGLCDREPERVAAFARQESLRSKLQESDLYGSLEEICASNMEAVVLITQPWLHAAQAVQVLEAGKHVYSAVPVVWLPDGDETLEWCDRIIATCRRTGKRYMLGETTYYRPEAMYCRRRAKEGAFGEFVYAEGEYIHDVDDPGCSLREVLRARLASKAGREWEGLLGSYQKRGIVDGPMHYPTHSTSGPVSVMGAHMVKVSAFPYYGKRHDDYFGEEPRNETALFLMSNGATVRICEHRQTAMPGRETFRVYGTQGAFENGQWYARDEGAISPSMVEMREALPAEVLEAFREGREDEEAYGGHGGSHAYLVHEFVEAVAAGRMPAINAWEAARYMAPGVMAHKSALKGGELLEVPDWGDAPG